MSRVKHTTHLDRLTRHGITLPTKDPESLHRAVLELRSAMEELMRQRGDVNDSAIRVRDLVKLGLIKPETVYVLTSLGAYANPQTVSALMDEEPEATPQQPTGLGGTETTYTIELDWNDAPAGDTAYYWEVWRATSNLGDPSTGQLIGSPFVSHFIDTPPATGTDYYYWVRAVNSNGRRSDFSAVAGPYQITALLDQSLPPAQPTGLTGTVQLYTVDLDWDDPGVNDSAFFWEVWRHSAASADPENEATLIATSSRSHYVDTPPNTDTDYYYWVRAVNLGLATSPFSAQAGPYQTTSVVVPDTTPPGAPTGVTATGAIRAIIVKWTAPADDDIAYYEVWRYTSDITPPGAATMVGTSGGTTYWDELAAGDFTTYWYYIRAVDIAGNIGPWDTTGGASASATTTDILDYANTLRPVAIVDTLPDPLPDPLYPVGSYVFLTTDKKLYKNDANTWVNAVNTADLSGTINLNSQVSGTLTSSFADAGLINSNVTINADGTLSGAGGGQATLNQLTGTISSGQIAANAVIAGKIDALAVTAGTIAAGAVTTNTMTANAINGDRITARTLDAGKIVANSITAGEIAAGAISTDELAANAVTATKIAIADFTEYCPNGDFQEGSTGWSLGAGRAVILQDAANGYSGSSWVMRIDPEGATSYAGNDLTFACRSGDKFYLNWWGKVPSTITGTIRVYVRWNDKDGTQISTSSAGDMTNQTAYTQFATVVTAPANTVTGRVNIAMANTAGTGYIGLISLRRQSGGELIVDGAITADKITVTDLESLNANMGNLTSGTITLDASGHIKSGQTAWNTGSGFWLGYNGGAGRFSLGNSAGDHIRWDGSSLTIVGSVSFATTSGSITGQGDLATQNTVDYGTDVTGTKPPSNADNTTTTINGGIITTGTIQLSTNGKIHSVNKTSVADTTAGVFLGWDTGLTPDAYGFAVGDGTNYMTWDGSQLTVTGELRGINNEYKSGSLYTLAEANTERNSGTGGGYVVVKRFAVTRNGVVTGSSEFRVESTVGGLFDPGDYQWVAYPAASVVGSGTVTSSTYSTISTNLTLPDGTTEIRLQVQPGQRQIAEPITVATYVRNSKLTTASISGEYTLQD